MDTFPASRHLLPCVEHKELYIGLAAKISGMTQNKQQHNLLIDYLLYYYLLMVFEKATVEKCNPSHSSGNRRIETGGEFSRI